MDECEWETVASFLMLLALNVSRIDELPAWDAIWEMSLLEFVVAPAPENRLMLISTIESVFSFVYHGFDKLLDRFVR